MIHWELQDHGKMTEPAIRYARTIIDIYHDKFTDSRHYLHQIVFPIYQAALKYLGIGAAVKLSIEPSADGNGNGIRFLTADEFSSFMAQQTGLMIRELNSAFGAYAPEETSPEKEMMEMI